MRRSYDPNYGSREQLKDCHQAGMALMRERDALKAEIAELKANLLDGIIGTIATGRRSIR